ncbi:hypothetical protein BDV96DRAFT_681423 [Lophiotrema nucula]|uniref:Uncharacterized protein n=1 Tax=Lophiotrema nucula TaxID=690887 RepID=A0A6A5ZWX7_9PLEO|nr:hypothetical protein BDV96DRAFT_681423 [Lophiotrema nucula]
MASDTQSNIGKASRLSLSGHLCFGMEKSTTEETMLRQQVKDVDQRQTSTDDQDPRTQALRRTSRRYENLRDQSEDQQRQSASTKPPKRSFTRKAAKAIASSLRPIEGDTLNPVERATRDGVASLHTYQLGALKTNSKLSLSELTEYDPTSPLVFGDRKFVLSENVDVGKVEELTQEERVLRERRGSRAAEMRARRDETFVERRATLTNGSAPPKKRDRRLSLKFIKVPVLTRSISQKSHTVNPIPDHEMPHTGPPETRSRWGQTESARNFVKRSFSMTRRRTNVDQHREDAIEPQQVAAPLQFQPLQTTRLEETQPRPAVTRSQYLPSPPRHDPSSRQQSVQQRQEAISASMSEYRSLTKRDSGISLPTKPLTNGVSQSNGMGLPTYRSSDSHLTWDTTFTSTHVPTGTQHTKVARQSHQSQLLEVPGDRYSRYPPKTISTPPLNGGTTGLSSRNAARAPTRTSQSTLSARETKASLSLPPASTYQPLSPYDAVLPGWSSVTIERPRFNAYGSETPTPPLSNHPANRSFESYGPTAGHLNAAAVRSVPRRQPQVTSPLPHETRFAGPHRAVVEDARYSFHSSSNGSASSQSNSPVRADPRRPNPCLSRRPPPQGGSASQESEGAIASPEQIASLNFDGLLSIPEPSYEDAYRPYPPYQRGQSARQQPQSPYQQSRPPPRRQAQPSGGEDQPLRQPRPVKQTRQKRPRTDESK